MKTLITISLVLLYLVSFSSWGETMDDLVERQGLFYKKFNDVPFSGEVDGKGFGLIKNGKRDGLWRFYDETGQLRRKGKFENGVKEGPWELYAAFGKLTSKGSYKNNKLDGLWVIKFDGLIWAGGIFKNDEKEGPWLEFKNGVIDQVASGTFKNGVKVNNAVPDNFAKSLTHHVSNYCDVDRCTEPITNLKIGLFSFDALGCTSDTRLDCYSLVFGVPENKITIENFYKHYSTYRIMNGSMPVNLNCVDGIPYGFQDLPRLWDLDGFGGVDWFRDRDYQRREKVYFNNAENKTFAYFSENPTTIGVFINTHSASGYGESITYLFDTVTGETTQIKGDCGGR